MNHHYYDIRGRILTPPIWWDEHAVPRYVHFSPKQVANIYADECVLMEIRCQSCGHQFLVALSTSESERLLAKAHGRLDVSTLAANITTNAIDYGDPPNVDCCPSGPTMSSVPVRVVEYWRRTQGDEFKWERDRSFERTIACDWLEDGP